MSVYLTVPNEPLLHDFIGERLGTVLRDPIEPVLEEMIQGLFAEAGRRGGRVRWH